MEEQEARLSDYVENRYRAELFCISAVPRPGRYVHAIQSTPFRQISTQKRKFRTTHAIAKKVKKTPNLVGNFYGKH